MRRESGPKKALFAILHPHHRERQAGTWPIDPEQLSFTRPVGKHPVQCKEQLCKFRRITFRGEILELRRARRYVIDDQISRQLHHVAEFLQVVPISKPGVDARVINWIESRVCVVDRIIERQQVRSAEQVMQRAVEQRAQLRNAAARQAIDVRD